MLYLQSFPIKSSTLDGGSVGKRVFKKSKLSLFCSFTDNDKGNCLTFASVFETTWFLWSLNEEPEDACKVKFCEPILANINAWVYFAILLPVKKLKTTILPLPNPFVPNATFLYRLKTSGRKKVRWE